MFVTLAGTLGLVPLACTNDPGTDGEGDSTSAATESGECTPGTLDCECIQDQCIDGLSCIAGVCSEEQCTPGAVGCECVDGACLGNNPCVEGICMDPGGDGDGDPTTGDGDGDPTTGDGDGDPTTGDGDGDGDGDGNPIPCAIPEAPVNLAVPQVMFVLDKSGSMKTLWDHDQNPQTPETTRWSSLHVALNSAISQFDDRLDFGAVLFPSAEAVSAYNETACIVSDTPDVPVGPNGQDVIAGIPPSNDLTIAGGTPAEDGVDVAGQHLIGLDASRPKAVVLITDGLANCGDDAATNSELFEVYDAKLPQTISDLWTLAQIPTYVVGIDIDTQQTPAGTDGTPDNSIPWCKLDEAGELGGKPANLADQFSCTEANTDNQDFYLATNDAQLQGALQTILTDTLTCRATLDPAPQYPDLLEIEIGGMPVPQVGDCANEDGWVYSNANGPFDSIELCGSYCTQVAAGGQTEALYFCEP